MLQNVSFHLLVSTLSAFLSCLCSLRKRFNTTRNEQLKRCKQLQLLRQTLSPVCFVLICSAQLRHCSFKCLPIVANPRKPPPPTPSLLLKVSVLKTKLLGPANSQSGLPETYFYPEERHLTFYKYLLSSLSARGEASEQLRVVAIVLHRRQDQADVLRLWPAAPEDHVVHRRIRDHLSTQHEGNL